LIRFNGRRLHRLRPFLFLAALAAGLRADAAGQTEDPAVTAQRGKQLLANGRFAEAAAVYDSLARVFPDNPGLKMNLGMALHMAGRDLEAVPPLEAALKSDPSLFPAALFLGGSLLKLGEPARAVRPLERAVSVDPGSPKAWHVLGACYEALAQQSFERLEKLAPESPWVLVLAGDRLARRGRLRDAFPLFRRAVTARPGLRGVRGALADIYRETGHPDWAAREEETERAIPPPDCRASRLECLFRDGNYREVLAVSRAAAVAEELYWRTRAANELAADALARLEQLPPSIERHQAAALTARARNRHREAVDSWKAALEFAPGDVGIRKELALSLHQSKDHAAAAALALELLRLEPNSAELNFMAGDSLANDQRAEPATHYLKKALAANPKLLAAHAALARAYLKTGQAALAVPHLKLALPVDDDGSLHFQLSRAYQSGGQDGPARQMLAKYQELRKKSELSRTEEPEITPP